MGSKDPYRVRMWKVNEKKNIKEFTSNKFTTCPGNFRKVLRVIASHSTSRIFR